MEKLKKLFSEIILGVIKKISIGYIKIENKEKLIRELKKGWDSTILEENKYLSLAPDDNVDISGYEEALESAMNNSSVKNIAISGTYGSGKSSFLRTFENKHDDSKWKYLKISLANFKNKKEGTMKTD
ncbi:MAG: hypothetical protein WBG30_06870, partial [Psychrilyobacter sp.]|uniref:YobI family P-loop NTPase n=1 Tax=Psychrilyobacter sp. TaxID=2586924 RepID=UPI003C716250